MIVKFKTKDISGSEVPHYLFLSQIPFDSVSPLYYVGVLGNFLQKDVQTFTNASLEALLFDATYFKRTYGIAFTDVQITNIQDSENSLLSTVAKFFPQPNNE